MLSFNDFLKVFDAYGKYISQSPAAPAAQAAPAAPAAQAAQVAPTAQDGITQMLTQMQAQLNQMQTPAPTINSDAKPVTVDDVIAKIFE